MGIKTVARIEYYEYDKVVEKLVHSEK